MKLKLDVQPTAGKIDVVESLVSDLMKLNLQPTTGPSAQHSKERDLDDNPELGLVKLDIQPTPGPTVASSKKRDVDESPVKMEEQPTAGPSSLPSKESDVDKKPDSSLVKLDAQPTPCTSMPSPKNETQATTEESDFSLGEPDLTVPVMKILQDEYRKIQDYYDDLKTITEDRDSFYKALDERMKDSLVIFNRNRDIAVREDKISYWKTRGMLLMASPQYAQLAVEAFTKTVKLDPTNIECWNFLGDCYSLLKDFDMSKKCFLTALDLERNATSLQNLSILSRSKAPRSIEDCQLGITYAKEALAIDFNNAKSWAILGNAYMSGFFWTGQDEGLMKKAINAYKQAEKRGISHDIDVLLNASVGLKYLEMYKDALNILSPSLTSRDYEWKLGRAKFDSLVKYLTDIQDLVNKKGKVRQKKRTEYLKRLSVYNPSAAEIAAACAFPSPRVKGVVVWILAPDLSYPYTVGVMTSADEVVVLSIYNLCRRKGFYVGDIINTPTDDKSVVDFSIFQYEFKFTKIRVNVPTDIFVNGKRLSAKVLNPYEFVSSERNDEEEA